MDKEAIRRLCLDAGACAVGFAAAEPVCADAVANYSAWLAGGNNAGMDYLARYDDVRCDPRLLFRDPREPQADAPAVATIICCAFAYRNAVTPRSPLFADYALGEDYHSVLRRALTPVAEALKQAVPGSQTRICVDTAPLRERYWAQRAGVGFVGRNNTLIVPGVGSRVFLAEILWSEAVPADEPCGLNCAGCGRCVAACPGGALHAAGTGLDARRCYSYLTIEHRGPLPEGTVLRNRIYGCDICQDVCPHNACAYEGPVLPALQPRKAVQGLRLADVAAMDASRFADVFRGSAVKRAGADGLRRNALCALASAHELDCRAAADGDVEGGL